MTSDVKGQEDRRPVYLPENRHHWASNDEVDKPVVDVTRGPIRARFRRNRNTGPSMSVGEWMRANLPKIGATSIVAIVILCVVATIYTDMARIVMD
ncbi:MULTISPECIES: hypothetical protein [Thalassospira]|jgi:hypothetical protein|uniref:Uncharacterized protein n=1 Tax=Thalassospira lucentensis TaxID=168935 RepID=A0A358HRD8_9PROT|nr:MULTISPECIES: hypothetical protein [Thalassospira]RCK28726.1 hypothetical protein TH1_09690 [Thalassospira lucentensis MCCC 1A00383 = DSM 14000]HBU97749.1 hypothetical protein [Thalassospira lucentensis]HCW66780.1 hypothetical protein [Thalassospira lucentensis]|tara:strand:- start:29064 stop:29351 length:288 start_codon:yes stop_codon:yes gene_type:complete